MFIYIIGNKEQELYKIGISKSPKERLPTIQTGCPFSLEIINTYKSKKAREIEEATHIKFKEHNTNGEWFKLTPALLKKVDEHIETAITKVVEEVITIPNKPKESNLIVTTSPSNSLYEEEPEEDIDLEFSKIEILILEYFYSQGISCIIDSYEFFYGIPEEHIFTKDELDEALYRLEEKELVSAACNDYHSTNYSLELPDSISQAIKYMLYVLQLFKEQPTISEKDLRTLTDRKPFSLYKGWHGYWILCLEKLSSMSIINTEIDTTKRTRPVTFSVANKEQLNKQIRLGTAAIYKNDKQIVDRERAHLISKGP